MKHTMKALAAAVALACTAGQCLAQTTVTMTAHGTFSSGFDGLGLFINNEGALAGHDFTLSLTLDATRMTRTWVGGENSLSDTAGMPAIASGTMTAGWGSYSWIVDGADAYATLSSNHNRADMGANGTNVLDGYGIWASIDVTPDAGSPRFVFGTDFAQVIDFSNFTGNSSIYMSIVVPSIPCGGPCPGGSGSSAPATQMFADSLDQVVWSHASASPVPEPAGWAMLAAGAGLVGLARRRMNAGARGAARVQAA